MGHRPDASTGRQHDKAEVQGELTMARATLRTARRKFLVGLGALAASMIVSYPGGPARAARSIKIGTFGGYFQDSFDKHVFPDFVQATGIEVESVAEPTGEAWLTQLESAAKDGVAPVDVSMVSQGALLRGEQSELWGELDLVRIPNHRYLEPHFIHRYADGRVDGIGAVAWYITLVTNTETYAESPTSWAELWDPRNRDSIGLPAVVDSAFLLEITAVTFFGGKDVLKSKGGVVKVLDKLVEAKPNVKLWYRDEGQFQQALQSGEIPMGQYYHDVTGIAAAEGFPVRSTFPKEGGVLDFGSWAVPRASKRMEEAEEFIDYMCRPEVQAMLSRKVGTAPTVQRKYTDLTGEEFAAVASDIPPIIPEYRIYLEWGDWLSEKWTELLSAS
jgi:putative spermidine/putrescine transport system substrate-binding protein